MHSKCVDFNPINAVRGVIGKGQLGFACWWSRFVDDTGLDMKFCPGDFEGTFDNDLYMNSPELEVFPERRAEHQSTVYSTIIV